jgi:hypothetical protein
VPRPKGARDKKERKRKETLPASRVREECERRFRKAFGRDFTNADRERLTDDIDPRGPLLDMKKWRRTLAFLALRDGRSMATGVDADRAGPLSSLEVAMIAGLLGFVRPALADRGRTAAQLLDSERANLEKARLEIVAELKSLPSVEQGYAQDPAQRTRVLEVLFKKAAKEQIRVLLDEGKPKHLELANDWLTSLRARARRD